ncbi:MAG: class II aldolase/adducin family protein [Methylacidiphilales bacterium]|nr:class II aldolase/adducin family protein [Candidatus Methylacidiphilales bacterium]MDW8349885.1 class II aldolase/adducin family protein [Verrucomicrobiae bacterium]
MTFLLGALPAENYLTLPIGHAPAAIKIDEANFCLACIPPNVAGKAELRYAIQLYRSAPLLAILNKGERATEKELSLALGEALLEPDGAPPSPDAAFCAYLLSLPVVNCVLHGHPTYTNQILCSPRAREFAKHRILPEETLAYGLNSLFIPYADPGLATTLAIKFNFEGQRTSLVGPIKLLLLQNHGVIALGGNEQEALRAYYTVEKAAQVWLGAALLGGPTFLSTPNLLRLLQMNEVMISKSNPSSTTSDDLIKEQAQISGQDASNKSTLGELSECKQPVSKDIESPTTTSENLTVRPEVPLFDEDRSSEKPKLNFTRRAIRLDE